MTVHRIVDLTGVVLWEGTDKGIANLKLAYARYRSPHLGYRIVTVEEN